MQEIYKNSLLLIHSLTQLCGVCRKYYIDPNDDSGNKIIEIVDNCEKKFLKVKDEIVRMVGKTESERTQSEEQEVAVVETLGGYLIRESDKE